MTSLDFNDTINDDNDDSWLINRFRPETREFFHSRSIVYVRSLFQRWCPHIVVSVHPLTQHIFARVLKELKLAERIPLVSVVTDPCYGFWKGWACDDVTLYLVASDDARRQLIDYGVAPERIKIAPWGWMLKSLLFL